MLRGCKSPPIRYAHTQTHTYAYTHMHTYIHTYIHAYMHTYTHAYTHHVYSLRYGAMWGPLFSPPLVKRCCEVLGRLGRLSPNALLSPNKPLQRLLPRFLVCMCAFLACVCVCVCVCVCALCACAWDTLTPITDVTRRQSTIDRASLKVFAPFFIMPRLSDAVCSLLPGYPRALFIFFIIIYSIKMSFSRCSFCRVYFFILIM